MSRYDVVVVGAGMVGATTALALAREKFRVALIDRQMPKAYDPASLDLRVSAVNLASWRIFENLGVAEHMAAQRISPFREMTVWNQQGEVHYDSAFTGLPCLGYIIENSLIQHAVLQGLQQFDNATLHCPNTITHWERNHESVTLNLDNQTIHCSLLVGADGGQSPIRQGAGIKLDIWDYAQHAVVANVKTEKHHKNTAWQRFLPTGPLAYLPMQENYCTIVWSTTPQHAKELTAMPDDAFCRRLAEAFDYRLGDVQWTSRRAAFPLRAQLAKSYVQDRLALVGDAAHTIHPLAGQGANIGFMDAACLAQTLKESREKAKDFALYPQLRPYERWRTGDNWLMLNLMSGFKHLFSNDNPALNLIRNLGLNITNHLPPLKQLIMQQASGTRGHLPLLAQNPHLR